MNFIAKLFFVLWLSLPTFSSSQTQDLLDQLALAPSAEAAKLIITNIQEAWINSHKDPSEKKLMTQALSAMDSGNLAEAEKRVDQTY